MNQEAQKTPGPIPGLDGTGSGSDLHPLLQKFVDNLKPIVIAFCAVVLVFGGYALYGQYQTKRVHGAALELAEIVSEYKGEELVTRLRGFVEQAPKAVRESALLELADALREQGLHEEAAQVWGRLHESADPNIAPVAVLGRAEALLQAGKAAEALALLGQFKNQAPPSYKPALLKLIAGSAERAGQLDAALAAYKELLHTEGVDERTMDFLEYKIAQLEAKVGSDG